MNSKRFEEWKNNLIGIQKKVESRIAEVGLGGVVAIDVPDYYDRGEIVVSPVFEELDMNRGAYSLLVRVFAYDDTVPINPTEDTKSFLKAYLLELFTVMADEDLCEFINKLVDELQMRVRPAI